MTRDVEAIDEIIVGHGIESLGSTGQRLLALRERLLRQDKSIQDMQRLNVAVDKATGAVDYQVALVGLALVARQFLREVSP